jgi:hypothetical protein
MARHSHGPLIERAAQIIGGDAKLREFLNATPERYTLWREGSAPLPWDLFLKTVDLLSDYYDEQIRRGRGTAGEARELRSAEQFRSAAGNALRGLTVVMREKVLAQRGSNGRQPSVRHALFDPGFVPRSRTELMETALDAALTVARTDLGDLQIVDAAGHPRVEAQRGFPPSVQDALVALEMGLAQTRPVFVPDLTTEPAFSSTREGEAIIGAGARAMASAPIVHTSGLLLGAISTHYREPHRKDLGTLALLQLVGRRTAAWLDARPSS